MSRHFSSLWDAIKFEVLNATDDELSAEALKTIQAIATSLSYGLTAIPQSSVAISRFLKVIVEETLDLLKEPQQKQARPAGQILASVAQTGLVPYGYLIKNTLPSLVTVYSAAEGITKQRAMLEVFNQLFTSSTMVYGEWGEMATFPTLENPIMEFKDKLFEVYSQALMGVNKEEVGFRIVALKGLGVLSTIRRFFADNEVGMVVQYFNEVVLENEEDSREELK